METGDLHGAIHGYKGIERFTAYRKYFSQRIVYLMDQLAKTPDMDGRTLLDNTLIYITSDMGDGGSHTNANTPVVLAGGAGGALVSGRSIVYGSETRLERMLDTICLAMGRILRLRITRLTAARRAFNGLLCNFWVDLLGPSGPFFIFIFFLF